MESRAAVPPGVHPESPTTAHLIPVAPSPNSPLNSANSPSSPYNGRGLSVLQHFLQEEHGARHPDSVQKRLQKVHNGPAILPDCVKKRVWDLLLLLCCAYHGILTPLVLFGTVTLPKRCLVAVELVISAVYAADIALGFFVAYVDDSDLLVEQLPPIRKHYLRKWVVADVIALPPLAISYPALFVLRLAKLFKVRALFLHCNAGGMTPQYVEFFFHYIPVVRIVFWFLLFLNLLACIQSNISHTPYADALFWCWTLLTLSPTEVHVSGPREKAFAAACMLFAVTLQGIIIGKFSVILLKRDVQTSHQQTMKELASIMEHYKVPNSLMCEVLSYHYHSLQQNVHSHFRELFDVLPSAMQQELNLYVKIGIISKVPLFKSAKPDCKVLLACSLKSVVVEPEEPIIKQGEIGREMFFITHGYADVIAGDGKIITTLKRGGFFGEVALLRESPVRTATVKALTYCDLFRLDKQDFDVIVSDFPDLREHIEEAMAKRMGGPPPQRRESVVKPVVRNPSLAALNRSNRSLDPDELRAMARVWSRSCADLDLRGVTVQPEAVPQYALAPPLAREPKPETPESERARSGSSLSNNSTPRSTLAVPGKPRVPKSQRPQIIVNDEAIPLREETSEEPETHSQISSPPARPQRKACVAETTDIVLNEPVQTDAARPSPAVPDGLVDAIQAAVNSAVDQMLASMNHEKPFCSEELQDSAVYSEADSDGRVPRSGGPLLRPLPTQAQAESRRGSKTGEAEQTVDDVSLHAELAELRRAVQSIHSELVSVTHAIQRAGREQKAHLHNLFA
eukprot:TRINITY_DN6647_c0_g1_i1.p1 TRINITY_DN6647_c0_g1~~TRINITY_DN6647_c0_g1_i1.p1  ORF type:complete len:796 (+),score=107.74 TRINITY_DN6647_c0_g1_i1:66-2453(+)